MLQHVNGSKDPKRKRATYEDLLKVPDHFVAEILDGELYTFPRPKYRHANATLVLASFLNRPLQLGLNGPGGWWILIEPEVHLGEDVLVPDIAGWRHQTLPVLLPEGEDPPYTTVAPDWICESLSPSTVKVDRYKKLRIYGREGVKHAWFVDALTKSIEIYALQGTQLVMQTTHTGPNNIREVPFEAVEIPMAYLWGATAATLEQEQSSEPR